MRGAGRMNHKRLRVADKLSEVEKAVTTVSDAVEGLTDQFDEGKSLQKAQGVGMGH